MTIQEAIRSGKPFRRMSFNDDAYFFDYDVISKSQKFFSVTDVMAYDWEVEEETIEITAGQLRNAWEKLFEESASDGRASYYKLGVLAKALGFKN